MEDLRLAAVVANDGRVAQLGDAMIDPLSVTRVGPSRIEAKNLHLTAVLSVVVGLQLAAFGSKALSADALDDRRRAALGGGS